MTDRELMQQALDALRTRTTIGHEAWQACEDAITALRERLAQPEQEPVAPKCGAIIEVFGKDWRLEYLSLPVGKHKLYTQQYNYTAPQPRQWQGLTDEEQNQVAWSCGAMSADWLEFARAIEAKLREKNA